MSTDSTPPPARGPVAPTADAALAFRPLPFGAARIESGFWADRQRTNAEVSIPNGLKRLRSAGNLDNLDNAGNGADAPYRGPLFMDSDMYKVLEAAAWEYGRNGADSLRREISAIASLLAKAQAPDGYLNSYVQVTRGDTERYRDLAMGHELYCFGHLIQAAVAAHRVAPDDDLWTVALAVADHMVRTFGPGRLEANDGHPVVEMALLELYRETGNPDYRDLAEYFVKSRGSGRIDGYGREPAYFSDRVPARDATTVEGHAVRAVYFAAGVADVVAEGADYDDGALEQAQTRQWDAMRATKTYLTGGLGSRWDGESFGDPYELPPDRAYAESCAAIGSIQWSWRRLLATGDAKYADLIERTLFNGFAAGVSLSGSEYFYVNALQVRADAEADDRRHPSTGRQGWYDVACCPPNIMRTLASLDHYLATSDPAGVQLHQYAAGSVRAAIAGGTAELTVRTEYPWRGSIEVEVIVTPDAAWTLSLRIPGWAAGATASVNGDAGPEPEPGGYLQLERHWRAGDRVLLELPVAPRLTLADPRIDAVRGCAAIERGPLVYCLEQADQPDGIPMDELLLQSGELHEHAEEQLLGGVVVVHAPGASTMAPPDPFPYGPAADTVPPPTRVELVAVPYCTWANRGVGPMRVWIPLATAGVPA